MNHDVTRIGMVVPPGNVAMERELMSYLPDNVVINTNRLSRPTADVTPESLLAMNESFDRAAHDLSMCYPTPGAILYGCTSGGLVLGPQREAEWTRNASKLCGIPVVTTTAAVVQGLKAAKAMRIYVVTPYIDAVNKHVIAFLQDSGVQVMGYDSFRRANTRDVAAISSDAVAEFVMQHANDIKECDALLISCTNLLTMDKIIELEQSLDKPVLTSNQCSLWAVLKHVGARAGKNAPGSLFDGMREH